MAVANKFNDFVEQLGLAKHNLNTDTLNVYLSNATPDATLDTVKADLAEISMTNMSPATPIDILNTYSETPAGTGTMVGTDAVWTATGAVATFRYVALYNDTQTAPADPLVVWWDYGSGITLASGETFTVDFGASVLTIT